MLFRSGLADDKADLLIVTSRGIGKRTAVSDFPVKGRATQGVIGIRLRQDDHVAVAKVIKPTSLITFVTTNGVVNRQWADGISRIGRATQGVLVVDLNNGDYVAAMSCEDPEEVEKLGIVSESTTNGEESETFFGMVDVE